MSERSHRSPFQLGDQTAPWGWIGLLVVAVLLAYANSFPGSFFFDDEAAIVQNASIRDLRAWKDVLWPPVEAGVGGRPFGNLTFALNYALSGSAPAGYHAVNLGIHLAAALLLFGLTRRTLLLPVMRTRFGGSATTFGAVVALLWALHPVQANIVDYLSQRTEGLMSMLYLLTLYAFVRSVTRTTASTLATDAGGEFRSSAIPGTPSGFDGWAVIAVIACLLGMATKEGMVTAPVMVLLYDRTFLAGSFLAAFRQRWPVLLALAGTWVLLAGLMIESKLSARGVGFDLNTSVLTYAQTECRAILRYVGLALWPGRLIFDYGTGFYLHSFKEAVPYALWLIPALVATGYALWRVPALGFVAAWFFLLLAPSSSFVPVAQQPCAENRVYLPLAGMVVLVTSLAYRAVGRVALGGLAAAAVALGVATYARNPVFSSELAIWWDTVAKHPTNARAENNLGNALLKLGRTELALPYIETAIRRSPNYADAHNNRGVALLRLGRPADAMVEFQYAIRDKDNYADAYYNLGEAYLQLHRDADALHALESSLEINPENPKAHNNLGIALLNLGRVKESIHEERIALALDDTMPEAHYNLGNSLAKAGQDEEALDEFDATLQLDPKFAKAHNNAGVILLHEQKLAEAGARFEAALRIDPNYPEAQRNLELVRKKPSPAAPLKTAPTTAAQP